MKKNIKYLVLSLLTVIGLAACTDSYEYTSAEDLAGAQVYFPTSNQSVYNVTDANGVVKVTVSRVNASEAMNAKLNFENTIEGFTLPATVQFAAGSKTADFDVAYTNLEYDTPATFKVSLDADVVTPYGNSDFQFTINRPAPWKTIGNCTLVEDFVTTFFNVSNIPYEVEIQENELAPGFFRLVNPFGKAYPYNDDGDYDTSKDYYMYVHAEDPEKVYIETFHSGMDWNNGYGEFIFGSVAGLRLAQGNPDAAEGHYGTLVNGEITFPVNSLIVGLTDYNGGGLYPANSNGAFSILLPGFVKADYSAAVSYNGIYTDKAGATYAVADLALGRDAKDAYVKIIVLPADADANAIADAMAAGEIEGAVAVDGENRVEFNAEELASSKLQVVVVVLSKDGEVKSVASDNFEYYGGGSTPWVSLGTGLFTDAIVAPLFGQEAPTYPVEILENTENPGVYRVMNPYSNSVYPYADDDCAPEGLYLEINAEDPEGVYVMQQSLGFDWGYGEFSFLSEGAMYLSEFDFATVKAEGLLGTVVDGVITLPSLPRMGEDEEGNPIVRGYYAGYLYMGASGYYAGDGFKVVLPSAVTPAEARKAAKSVKSSFDRKSFSGVAKPKYMRYNIVKNPGKMFVL